MHINSILLNIDRTIKKEKPDRQFVINKMDEITSLTEHMSQTIEDFRHLFKTDEEPKVFTLDSAVNDALVLMSNQLFDIDLKINLLEETTIKSSKTELIQVIIIILANAIEAFRLQQIKDKKINISSQKWDEKLLISIEDNAGGITPEHLEKIFDPYFTSKKQSGGTGLGLYIADIIITQKMNGKLSVSNTPSGAKFSITLAKQLN